MVQFTLYTKNFNHVSQCNKVLKGIYRQKFVIFNDMNLELHTHAVYKEEKNEDCLRFNNKLSLSLSAVNHVVMNYNRICLSKPTQTVFLTK